MRWICLTSALVLAAITGVHVILRLGHKGQCLKYLSHGNGAVKGCHKCAHFYPWNVDECMECGGVCFKKMCSKQKDVHQCLEGEEFKGCHKQCMGNSDKVDSQDCYFDPSCREKVDWEKIGDIKGGFFKRLDMLHRSGNATALGGMLTKVHHMFAQAGVPEDRVDYILTKWVEHSLPEGLEQGFAKHANITINGLGCDNSYGMDLNQKFVHRGYTLDGRPYYQGTSRPDRFIYYDSYCADDTREPRWLLGGEPDTSRHQGLNPRDGKGCDNDFSIVSGSMHLPGGLQRTAWKWCGDYGSSDGETVSVTYEVPRTSAKQVGSKTDAESKKLLGRVAETKKVYLRGDSKEKWFQPSITINITVAHEDKCSKYAVRGPVAMRGCARCLRGYPDQVDECMSCGFRCFHKHCGRDSDKYQCLTGQAMSLCHKECMGEELLIMARRLNKP